MNYQDTVQWMFSQLPMYQNKGISAYKSDLTNSLKLAAYLGHPETKFKSVHVAGTNGKGSTSHMLASILQEAGYNVGLYTSPHLKDFRERIKLNGQCISKNYVIGFIKKHKAFFEENQLSFFEMTVGLAFDYYAKKNVDIAIIEVGLGGRLDSTNIIDPELAIITNIGLDHTQFLGNTLASIAKEKAGVIKPNVPVVIGVTQAETASIFKEIAKQNNSKITFADKKQKGIKLNSDLKGNYQIHNLRTTVMAVEVLNDHGFKISKKHQKLGLMNVIVNTGLRGRWQLLESSPKIICDTAHNREGLTYTMQQLNEEIFKNLHLVLGFVNDKNLDGLLDLFPRSGQYYFCKPKIERGMDATILKKTFEKSGLIGKVYNSVEEALKMAKENADKNDLIYVGGSTFVVSEIL
ncbi:MAG: bifunctional folylpolyglutamate synthase/dihydrofolate synthase [Flavobacteriaceae bacterium]|nr:MAG: bifunctional folylpolyglutamate synthase/dihydrofolate synthase [Flavobacteriaceae bacterium]